MKSVIVALICLSSLILSSCVTRHGDFSVLSNKIVRLSEFELDKADRTKNVVGKDVMHIICFIPTKGNISLEEALDNALEKGDGDVMTDAVIKSYGFYIPYIYGQMGWVVKGDVVKTRNK
jgi:predicted small secreted protein